jgi:hypothetical protein
MQRDLDRVDDAALAKEAARRERVMGRPPAPLSKQARSRHARHVAANRIDSRLSSTRYVHPVAQPEFTLSGSTKPLPLPSISGASTRRSETGGLTRRTDAGASTRRSMAGSPRRSATEPLRQSVWKTGGD